MKTLHSDWGTGTAHYGTVVTKDLPLNWRQVARTYAAFYVPAAAVLLLFLYCWRR